MDLTEQHLTTSLRGKMIGDPLHFVGSTGSTNTLAFSLADQGASEGTVVIADCQTAGKGRMRRLWESPSGLNLYTSVILIPDINPVHAPFITVMTGVAVADLLTHYCPGGVHLKWPNDVYVGDKKICGILSEIKTTGKRIKFIVVGVGININMTTGHFPSILAGIATSLKEERGEDCSRLEVAVTLYDALTRYYTLFLSEGFEPIRERWLSFTRMIGQRCEVACGGEICRGKVVGIDESGALLMVTKQDKMYRVLAGDATVIKDEKCCW